MFLNAYVRKKRSKINALGLYLKKPEEEKHIKNQNTKKEMIKIGAETNEIGSGQTIEKNQ